MVKRLEELQNGCLRAVCGAYKATPVRLLELEAAVPPLDIYLSYRNSRFERKLESRKTANLLQSACDRAANQLGSDGGPVVSGSLPASRPMAKRQAAFQWAEPGKNNTGVDPSYLALKEHWYRHWITSGPRKDRSIKAIAENSMPGAPKIGRSSIYWQLPRRLASALIQIRTGRIGLSGFLWKSKAFGTYSPLCRCGEAPETVEHLVFYCILLEEQQRYLRWQVELRGKYQLASRGDLAVIASKPWYSFLLAKWVLSTGRLVQLPSWRKGE